VSMGGIFINYQRSDMPAAAGWLHERLVQVFGRDNVFIDVDGMIAGGNYAKQLEVEVAKCDVLLALIGRNWLAASRQR
jgi:hypothetical protein